MEGFLLALYLVALTGPDGQVIVVNPQSVVSIRTVREPTKGQFGKDVQCLIHTSDGKFLSVVESCEVVRERLENN
jgi:hypothetical protein